MRAPIGIVALCLALAACPGENVCRVGRDCVSGICLSSGSCAPVGRADAGGGEPADAAGQLFDGGGGALDAGGSPDAEIAPADASSAPDGGAGLDASGPASDAATGSCLPNNDGTINRDELPVVLGASVTFRIAQSAPVDLTGTTRPDGTRVWDFTAVLPGDHDVVFKTAAVTGQWFASSFAPTDFTLRMNGADDTLGVLSQGADALLLEGMASPAQSTGATRITFQKDAYTADKVAISTLSYPLKKGATWSTSGVLKGDYNGDTYNCDPLNLASCTPFPGCCIRHTYDAQVDAVGEVVTPFAPLIPFKVVRVKTVVSIDVLVYGVWTAATDPSTGDGLTMTQYSFISECFGPVAVVNSKKGETAANFTTAGEIRRLAP